MAYQVIARKWRPQKFDDVVGQNAVTRTLRNALASGRLAQSFVFAGPRGVGKTTTARILARSLNCEQGPTSTPCGVCTSCREVDSGRFVDLLEIDAASNTGVDNVRELIDNSQYAPARGRYKVYLIDEVHMLSKSAFNALLKTLEEPPPHVKFILATTDPQKLPITVLSRCLQFNLKRLPVAVIREQLGKVLEQENVAYETGAIGEIARAADGSMRDGLSLLDQAIAFSGGAKLERGPVEDMLGTSGRQVLYAVLGAIAEGDGPALLQGIQQLEARAPDYSALLNDLAAYLQRIAVLQVLPAARSEDDDAELLALIPQMAAEDVQLCYQIAVSGRRDLPWAPDPRSGFEMTLLRMLAFRPEEPGGTRSGTATPTSTAPPRKAPPQAARAEPVDAAKPLAAPPAAPMPAVPRLPPQDLPWAERIDTLGVDGSAHQLARQCAWLGESEGVIRLSLTAAASFLLQEPRRVTLEQALSQQAGAPRRLVIEVASTEENPLSPAQLEQQRAKERQRQAQVALDEDAVVRAFKEQFGATVRPGSIQPN